MRNFKTNQIFAENSVVIIPQKEIVRCTELLNELMTTLKEQDSDVSYTFLAETVLPIVNKVKETLYQYVLSPRELENTDTNGNIELSNSTFGNIQHYFNPLIGWVRLLVHSENNLPAERIDSWVARLTLVRSIFARYIE